MTNSFSVWNAELNAMESSEMHKYSFLYEDTTVWVTWGYQTTGSSEYTTYRYRYSFFYNGDGLVDSVAYFNMIDGGSDILEFWFTYDYTDGRLMSIVTSNPRYTPDSYNYYDFTYNTDGLVESYTQQSTTSYRPSRTNQMKVVYTYTTIPLPLAVYTPRHTPSPGSVTAAWNKGGLQISVPPGSVINDIRQFDLRGRLVNRFQIPHIKPASTLTIPSRQFVNTARLLQVNTDRGSFNLIISWSSQ